MEMKEAEGNIHGFRMSWLSCQSMYRKMNRMIVFTRENETYFILKNYDTVKIIMNYSHWLFQMHSLYSTGVCYN